MKFMKLGSKPDTFQDDGDHIRYVLSDLETDIIINVGDVKFYLHKFPLLSKSNHLQKLTLKANEENCDEIHMNNFPGGPKAFEICTKFCYGIAVTLNAYNVVAARCAAEYLEMTEAVDKGNLIFKIEVFLNSSVFRSWKDSIIVLQTTKSLLPWSEDLKIVGRCVDSIASKTSLDPSNVNWSYTYNRKAGAHVKKSVPKDWWVEDICELDIDLYKRVMIGVKSKGRMTGYVIGEALKAYAIRWLPDSVSALVSEKHCWGNRCLVETLIHLLPKGTGTGTGCSCSFLLKLLKVGVLVGASESAREELVMRISLKLDEASVNDLLIPAQYPQTTIYDVKLVARILDRFEKSKHELEVFERDSKGGDLRIGKLVDNYLIEVARDPNLPLSSFADLSEMIPEASRPIHDDLYRAIDIYMKEHPWMTKGERKKICGLMDIKKLSTETSMHAAQNERLPLRVVVQVLFFEQLRSNNKISSNGASNSTSNTEEDWEKNSCPSLKRQMSQLKIKEEEEERTKKMGRNKSNGAKLVTSRSRRIFDKLWFVGKGQRENRSSESSSNSASSRHRRYSVS